jgi:hypothetical protein
MIKQTPYFLWDYNLNEEQINQILHGQNDVEKLWLISRILTHAKFDDIWKYLTAQEIVNVFPKLKLPTKVKRDWERAFNVWGYHVQTT